MLPAINFPQSVKGCCRDFSTSDNRALILDGHSRAAVETLQALGRLGIEVDICSEWDCLAFHSRYSRRIFRQPPTSCQQKLVEWICLLDAHYNYQLIVASTEFSLRAFQLLPTDHPVRAKALLPGNESLSIALDKQRTCELASDLGIAIPKTVVIDSALRLPAVVQYPVVLKPRHSVLVVEGSTVTVAPKLVKDDVERRAVLEKWAAYAPILQQDYVSGFGVGVELLFNHGRKVWHFAHERIHEYPLTGGASTYRRSVHPNNGLLDVAERLLTALRWHGVAMVEFKMARDGSFYLIEINPRLWGSLALSIDAGVNFPLGLWMCANNEVLPAQPSYKAPYYTRDLTNDLQWIFENFRADHRDPLLLTRPRLRAFAEYLRPLFGRESWDHFHWRDPKVILAILGTIRRRYSKVLWRRVMAVLRQSKMVAMHRRVVRKLAHRTTPIRSLLFLCHGNICRSPLAEQLGKRALPNLEIESAGFHESEGRRSPKNIILAASRMGIDLMHFSSRCITKQQIEHADLIVVMDANNYGDLIRKYPEAANRTLLLGLFLERPTVNIADPYQACEAQTWDVVSQINQAIDALADQVRRGESRV
jgi:protein-tyrosine-phosphatase/predicted ATP-grasp superfamily ATP-dependent carboligase